MLLDLSLSLGYIESTYPYLNKKFFQHALSSNFVVYKVIWGFNLFYIDIVSTAE